MSFLTDAYSFQFKDVVLHHALKSWQDKVAFRNAVHEYLNRPGGEVQPMLRRPAEFVFSCFYLGKDWAAQYRALHDSLDESNKGPLIHPLLGSMPAAVDEVNATSTPGTGRNLIEFQLKITEDRVDTRLVARTTPPSPQQAAAAATEKAGALVQVIATMQQAQTAVNKYVGLVEEYVALALSVASGFVFSTEIGALLVQIGAAAEACQQAIRGDEQNTADASVYPQLIAVDQTYAACLQLDDAVRSARPQPETCRVQAAAPLLVLCQQWYGGPAALEYAAIIEELNRLPNPGWVPAGYDLIRPPPTVK